MELTNQKNCVGKKIQSYFILVFFFFHFFCRALNLFPPWQNNNGETHYLSRKLPVDSSTNTAIILFGTNVHSSLKWEFWLAVTLDISFTWSLYYFVAPEIMPADSSLWKLPGSHTFLPPSIVATGQDKQANKPEELIVSFPYRWKVRNAINKCPFVHKAQWFFIWRLWCCSKGSMNYLNKNARLGDIHHIVILRGH